MASYIIGACILAYVIFVLYRKVKRIKEGKYCNCGCENCPSGKQCREKSK